MAAGRLNRVMKSSLCSISSTSKTPIIIHHAIGDRSAAYKWSEQLAETLYMAGIVYAFWSYEGDDHLFTGDDLELATQRDDAFFAPGHDLTSNAIFDRVVPSIVTFGRLALAADRSDNKNRAAYRSVSHSSGELWRRLVR